MDYLLCLSIRIIYARIWIPNTIHYMEGYHRLMYICIYGYTTNERVAVIFK
jgi:hypothetical protein